MAKTVFNEVEEFDVDFDFDDLVADVFGKSVAKVKLNPTLAGKKIIFYGSNSLGKTKQASRLSPYTLFIPFEAGTNAISKGNILRTANWADFRSHVRKLTTNKKMLELIEQGKTVVVVCDGLEVAAMMAKQWVCDQAGVETIQKIPHGAGWSTYEKEVLEQVTIKPSTNKVILIGTKYISGVGGRYWTWPTNSTNISSHYGYRCFSGSCSFHQAIDITSNYGAPIYAANNGIVTMATYSYGTYGIFVAINHNNGYATLYAHMQAFAPNLRVGSTVARGQLIGYMGSTGNSTGPHVHFEVWRGSNPYAPGAYNINPWSIY